MKIYYPGDAPTLQMSFGVMLQPGVNDVEDDCGKALLAGGLCTPVPVEAPSIKPVPNKGKE